MQSTLFSSATSSIAGCVFCEYIIKISYGANIPCVAAAAPPSPLSRLKTSVWSCFGSTPACEQAESIDRYKATTEDDYLGKPILDCIYQDMELFRVIFKVFPNLPDVLHAHRQDNHLILLFVHVLYQMITSS